MRAAIVGFGVTAAAQFTGSLADLAGMAVHTSLDDAALSVEEIDGLLIASRPSTTPRDFAKAHGFGDLRLLGGFDIDGVSTVAMIERAALAIAAGRAESVLCVLAETPQPDIVQEQITAGLFAARFLAVTDTDRDSLSAVAATARLWAASNPLAPDPNPLDLSAYEQSTCVASPLRALDFALPSSGSAAIVVSARRPNHHQPIVVTGLGTQHVIRRRRAPHESWFGGGIDAARAALAEAGLAHMDIDVIELADPNTAVLLWLLETYGFVDRGSSGRAALDGKLAPEGSLPANTGGGQLSGFSLHDMTPVVEAIEQLRGDAGERQVKNAGSAFVGAVDERLESHACLVLEREDR